MRIKNSNYYIIFNTWDKEINIQINKKIEGQLSSGRQSFEHPQMLHYVILKLMMNTFITDHHMHGEVINKISRHILINIV